MLNGSKYAPGQTVEVDIIRFGLDWGQMKDHLQN